MKKILLTITMIVFAATSFAADFAPVAMELSVQSELVYQFDGSELTIPFEQGGKPGAVWLVINTKGKADEIVKVQNGMLGWHYVNKIDTTVYVSPRYQRDIGSNTIVWEGDNNDGALVDAGEYSYYLWAYDDQSPRIPVSNFCRVGFDWDSQYSHIYEKGEDGLALIKPLIMGTEAWYNCVNDAQFYWQHGAVYKWEIGSDPDDENAMRATWCAMYQNTGYAATYSYGAPVFNPSDYSIFYHCSTSAEQNTNTFLKWEFVTDGEAILDETWLGWDDLVLEDKGQAIGVWTQKPSCFTDGNYIYGVCPGLHQKQEEWNKLRCVSFDGELIFDKMLHEWYMPDDNGPNEYVNGAFHHLYSRGNNNWFILSHTSCMHEMIDTTRLLEDADDEVDMIVFQNANGDYYMDNAWQADFEPAWICLHDEETKVLRRDSIAIDAQGFNVMGCSYLGLASFGVSTQDGTGIDVMSFADDTNSDNQSLKGGGILADSGSAYDGLYYQPTAEDGGGSYGAKKVSFCAFASAGGVITDTPGAVEEEAVAAFAVDQNTPNPFNPTTTIGFTITEAGHVSVDIYNVAGQKVDTLVNDAMSAGRHSLVWDASGMSAGVYFYTVKSGDFSKTMKMTLLK